LTSLTGRKITQKKLLTTNSGDKICFLDQFLMSFTPFSHLNIAQTAKLLETFD
jgi:hypothetical protein